MNSLAWSEIVSGLASRDVDSCANAASRLHSEASAEDIPALLGLLDTGDFLVREAAAWPLVELAGLNHLPQLLLAYQRGFDEGHDNDGLSAALLDKFERVAGQGTRRGPLDADLDARRLLMLTRVGWLPQEGHSSQGSLFVGAEISL